MAIAVTNNTPTVGTTEYFVESNSTTATYQTADTITQLFVDVNVMAAGDEFLIQAYEKVDSTTARVFYKATLVGAQTEAWVSPTFVLTNGWEWSLKKIAGTDRALPVSLRKIT